MADEKETKNILQIRLTDNLDRVAAEVSLVAIVEKMAAREGVSPALKLRRLVAQSPDFRTEMARIMREGL